MNAVERSGKAVPAHWRSLEAELRARPGHSVSLWWNVHGGGGSGGYTAQVRDHKGGFAPNEFEGHIWSFFAPDAVAALDGLARLIHEFRVIGAPERRR